MIFLRSGPTDSSSQETADQILHNRVAASFVALQLSGGCGLLIVVLTATFGKGVKRYSTWYSFVGSWIFSCISYTLLAFAGQRTGPPPDYALCVIQSALIYAAPSLTACTTLALVTHMLLNLRRLLTNRPFSTETVVVASLLILPYVVWLAEFIGVFVYGFLNPDTVRRSPNSTYCDSTNPVLSKISSMVVLACMTLIILLQGIIAVRLYRNRSIISGSGHSITMVARVMLFSVLGALALGVAVAYVISWQHDLAFDMILASLPVMAFLIFGSQLDLVRIWTCRGNKRQQFQEKKLLLHTQYASVSTQDSA